MRKIITSFLLFIGSISVFATEFAPVGSKWVRCSKFYQLINQDIFESKCEIEMDGKKVKQIEHTTINYSPAPDGYEKVVVDTTRSYVYAYNVGDSVFYKGKDEFVLLFVYNRTVGDTLNLQWVDGEPGETYKATIKEVEKLENGSKRYIVSYMTPNNEWSPFGDAVFEDGLGVVAYRINGFEICSTEDYPIYGMTTADNTPKLVYTQNQYGLIVLDESLYKELASVNTVSSNENIAYYDKESGKLIISDSKLVKGELLSINGELIKSFTANEVSLGNNKQQVVIVKLYMNSGLIKTMKILQ